MVMDGACPLTKPKVDSHTYGVAQLPLHWAPSLVASSFADVIKARDAQIVLPEQFFLWEMILTSSVKYQPPVMGVDVVPP